MLVWSEQDVQLLLGWPAVTQITVLTATDESPAPTASNSVHHVGKFRALWAWLRDQPGAELPVTFDEIEEVIGMPLPRSCRRHPAHWSSYEGSAVARAIQDAGWTATKVNLGQQRLVLVRRDRAPPTTVDQQHARSAEVGDRSATEPGLRLWRARYRPAPRRPDVLPPRPHRHTAQLLSAVILNYSAGIGDGTP